MNCINYDIVIFGISNSFGYNRIGGLDSLYRRVANILIKKRERVCFLHYNCEQDNVENPIPGLTIVNFNKFDDSLEWLSSQSCPVIVNSINRNDRLKFIKYRNSNKRKIFHQVYSVFSESLLRRNLYLLESMIYPYNGVGFCLSERLKEAVNKRRNHGVVFLPPVSDIYFLTSSKPISEKIRITFLGRTDLGKGSDIFLNLAKHFEGDKRFLFSFFGYLWPDSKASVNAHEILTQQTCLDYNVSDLESWSPEVDANISSILHNTDILVLPYRKLSSTADTPLLLLEGMAAGCCILTPRLGNLATIYGDVSPFIIDAYNFSEKAIEVINRSGSLIENERNRVFKRIREVGCDEESTWKALKTLIPSLSSEMEDKYT